jgi:hypothetical protein
MPKNNDQAYSRIVKLETAFNAILQQFQALSDRVSKLESTAKGNNKFHSSAFSTNSFNFNSDYHSEATTVNAHNKRVRTVAPSRNDNQMLTDNTPLSFNFESHPPIDSAVSGQTPTSTVVSSHDPELGNRLDSLESTASKIMHSMSQFSQILSGHSFLSDSSNSGSSYNPPAPQNDQ